MKEIEKFKDLINDSLFYEAHEALEELWFPIRKTKDSYCLVLKGFINGSVAMELFKKDKIKQSKQIYQIYLKYTNEKRINDFDNNKEFHDLRSFMDEKFELLYNNPYHLQTKHSYESIRQNQNYMDWSSQPDVFKNYSNKKMTFLEENIDNHQFLNHIAGLNVKKTYPGVEYFLRYNPSAGALYPIELYFQARNVDGFRDAIYHYEPNKNEVAMLGPIDEETGLEPFILQDTQIDGFIFLYSSVYYRSSWKYKNRALRYCLLDAGHMLGSTEASSYIYNKECRIIYDFKKEELNELFAFEHREFFTAASIVGDGHKKQINKIQFDLEYCEASGTFSKNSTVYSGYQDTVNIQNKTSQNSQAKFNFNKDAYKQSIIKRRSLREFEANSISKIEFESILDIINQPIFSDCDEEVSVYCVINNVSNMYQGLYKDGIYLRTGDFKQMAGYLCLEQKLGHDSAVTIFLTTSSDNYQAAYQKAGILGHRFYLVSEYLGIGCSGIGAYYDNDVNRFIEKNEMVLYGVTIGR